jgi:hypothetical protein
MEICGREMAGKFSLKMLDFHVAFRDLLYAVNLRHGTHSFTYLPEEGVLRIFFFALENPTASAGFENAKLGSKGQHSTSRPPKTLNFFLTKYYLRILFSEIVNEICLLYSIFPKIILLPLIQIHVELYFFSLAQQPLVGPGPPHYRSFTITLGRTPLDE